ncbi:hypothetical protein II582_03670 [bacterium]|nr:hypothetical protein [bacterium]
MSPFLKGEVRRTEGFKSSATSWPSSFKKEDNLFFAIAQNDSEFKITIITVQQ